MVWDGGHVITTLVKHVDPDHDNPSRWGFRTAERVKEARQTNLSEVLRTLQPRTGCWGRIRLISKIILVVDGDGNSLLICLLRSISKYHASHHWLSYHPWHIGFDSVLVPTFSHSIQQWMSAVSAFYLYISTCKLFPAEYILLWLWGYFHKGTHNSHHLKDTFYLSYSPNKKWHMSVIWCPTSMSLLQSPCNWLPKIEMSPTLKKTKHRWLLFQKQHVYLGCDKDRSAPQLRV